MPSVASIHLQKIMLITSGSERIKGTEIIQTRTSQAAVDRYARRMKIEQNEPGHRLEIDHMHLMLEIIPNQHCELAS